MPADIPPPGCALYLVTPPLRVADLAAFTPRLRDVLAAAPFASALARVAPGSEGDAKAIVAALTSVVQDADCALLSEGDPRLAARAGADGVHVAGAGEALTEALKSLKPERIVGAGRLRSRDEAMSAGEAGADYVMFGELRADGSIPPLTEVIERVGWWAEIFQTPCVAYAPTLEAAETLARVGADFVALGEALWSAAAPADVARAAHAAITRASLERAR